MNRHDAEWSKLVAEILEISNENPAYVKRLLLELYGRDIDNIYATRSISGVVQSDLSEEEIIGLAAYLRAVRGKLADMPPVEAVVETPQLMEQVELKHDAIAQADSDSWLRRFLRHPMTGPGPIALTVTILGTVIAGLILAYVFGIGK